MRTIAIVKDSRLGVDDRGLVALRFTAEVEATCALQMIYLEGPNADLPKFNTLMHACGTIGKLDGTPVLVEKDPGTMVYLEPLALS